MPARTSGTGSAGFSARERAAMKGRAAELRAEGNKGARQAGELQKRSPATGKRPPDW
jgi:hypothetical protein